MTSSADGSNPAPLLMPTISFALLSGIVSHFVFAGLSKVVMGSLDKLLAGKDNVRVDPSV